MVRICRAIAYRIPSSAATAVVCAASVVLFEVTLPSKVMLHAQSSASMAAAKQRMNVRFIPFFSPLHPVYAHGSRDFGVRMSTSRYCSHRHQVPSPFRRRRIGRGLSAPPLAR